jgi:hypothetical protein
MELVTQKWDTPETWNQAILSQLLLQILYKRVPLKLQHNKILPTLSLTFILVMMLLSIKSHIMFKTLLEVVKSRIGKPWKSFGTEQYTLNSDVNLKCIASS